MLVDDPHNGVTEVDRDGLAGVREADLDALAGDLDAAAAADAGIDADALAEHLQRHAAGAFTADWAALLTAIKEKAAKLTS